MKIVVAVLLQSKLNLLNKISLWDEWKPCSKHSSMVQVHENYAWVTVLMYFPPLRKDMKQVTERDEDKTRRKERTEGKGKRHEEQWDLGGGHRVYDFLKVCRETGGGGEGRGGGGAGSGDGCGVVPQHTVLNQHHSMSQSARLQLP